MLDPVELFPEVPNLYEFPSVHADMVYDERRVTAYKRAIDSTVKKGDVVVDVGAGTGLLSFLCLQAGAKRVHAIERSPVIKWAKLLAEKNDFADRIVFHNDDARNVEIGEKADVVVSELIGHLAFEEGMAETIADTKGRFLKQGGALIPENVTLRAALVNEKEIYDSYINGWEKVCGIDYSFMREQAVKKAYVTDIAERDLLSESAKIFSVDFSQSNLSVKFNTIDFKVFRKGFVNGVALWFDAQLSSSVKLSSSPWTKTHWKQCFVPFDKSIKVIIDDELSISFELKFRVSSEDKFILNVMPLKRSRNA